MNKYTFFYSGPFSQWAKTPFMDVDQIVYNTAEQYMMAKKALLFHDTETYQKIMNTKDPKEQKQLGRQVKDFNERMWNVYSILIVTDGNILKFSQNHKEKELLLNTKGTILVEASPYDKVWGIGLKDDDPQAQFMNLWQGENRLGFILTHVRDLLISEEK
jgi:ribA/ribD-fused uncharacterized protein